MKKLTFSKKATSRIGGNKLFKPDEILSCLTEHDQKNFETYNKQVEDIKIASQLVNSPFTDNRFPPEVSSLTKNVGKFKKATNYIWLRAGDIFHQQEFKIFEGMIEPNDIKQGQLGDCYFLSSLSALAERPNLIQRLFASKVINDQHCYCVWLCHDGLWQPIILDDTFPCNKDKTPAFSKSNGNELWVLLLEKAYAKIFGSYDKIEAGVTGYALRDLTGAPFTSLECKNNVNKVWEFVCENDKKCHILTASSASSKQGVEFDMGQGIVSSHAYSILDCREVNTYTGKVKLIQLRNPWGHKEWTGDWSDKSDKWTPELKLQLSLVDADDGIFWMTVQDFCQHFGCVYANHLQEDYHYSAQKVDLQHQNRKIILFQVNQDNTHAYISLQQKDQRNFVNENFTYKCGLISFAIAEQSFKEYKGDKYTMQRDCFIETTFKQGIYLAYIETTQQLQQAKDVVISAYSSSQIKFLYKEVADPNLLDKYLDNLIKIKPPEQKQLKVFEQDHNVQRKQIDLGSYVAFSYSNKSQSSTLIETVTMNQLDCLEICPPQHNPSQFEVTIGPGQEQVVKYRIKPEKNGAFGYGLQIMTKFQKKC